MDRSITCVIIDAGCRTHHQWRHDDHSGYVTWPFIVGMIRLAIAVLGGWLALSLGGGALALFVTGAAAFALFSAALLATTYRRFNGRLNAGPAAASLR